MGHFTLFLIFFLVTTFFGFVVSRFVFKEKRLFALVPFSILIGINSFNFSVNIFSYFIPLTSSVWAVLVLELIVAFVILMKRGPGAVLVEHNLTSTQTRWLFGIAIAISLLSGAVALKALALDDLFIGHIPLAETIAEGNFPVVDPSSPEHILSYHYGSDLLSAALKLIAGIPIWLGYDIQTIFFSGSFFLLLFVLLFDITGKYRTSVIGAGLFMYGAGLQWINFFTGGIPAMWQRFVLHENVPAFWKFLVDVTFPKLNTSFIHTMHNHSTALGMPMLFLALILYFRTLETENKKQWAILTVMSGVIFGYLALNLETYYVIASIAFITMLIAHLLNKKWKIWGNVLTTVNAPRFISTTLIVLCIGFVLAYFQGGVIKSIFHDTDSDKIVPVSGIKDFVTLNFAPNPAKLDNSDTYIYLFSPEFFKQFGIPLLLIIPAVVHLWRRREGKLLHLFIIGLGAFLIPFLFRLPSRPWEVSRFFVLGMPMIALLVGVYLSHLYEKYRDAMEIGKKRIVIVLIGLVVLTGVISQTFLAISTFDAFGTVTFKIAKPPLASPIDEKAFAWIRDNTTLENARFFPYDHDFIRSTGRYTPGVFPYFTFSLREKEQAVYDKLVSGCSPQSVKELGVNYFYVSPNFPIKDYKSCLKKLGAKQVYNDSGPDGFREIYRIE